MKTSTKILGISATVAMLAAASIFGTLAYLTDNDKAENSFTIGQVQIKLDEADAKADPTATTAPERVQKNDYHVVPGDIVVKDPTVTVLANSENCYVRMLVTVNQKENLDAIFKAHGKKADLGTIFGKYNSEQWEYIKATKDDEKDTRTYEFRYTAVVPAATSDTVLPALFQSVSIPTFINNDDSAKLANGFKIDIVANAIQSVGFDDANAAWEAFDAQ